MKKKGNGNGNGEKTPAQMAVWWRRQREGERKQCWEERKKGIVERNFVKKRFCILKSSIISRSIQRFFKNFKILF